MPSPARQNQYSLPTPRFSATIVDGAISFEGTRGHKLHNAPHTCSVCGGKGHNATRHRGGRQP